MISLRTGLSLSSLFCWAIATHPLRVFSGLRHHHGCPRPCLIASLPACFYRLSKTWTPRCTSSTDRRSYSRMCWAPFLFLSFFLLCGHGYFTQARIRGSALDSCVRRYDVWLWCERRNGDVPRARAEMPKRRNEETGDRERGRNCVLTRAARVFPVLCCNWRTHHQTLASPLTA